MRLRLPVILICLCTAGWGGIALSDEPKHPCPPGRQCGVVGGILPPNAKSVTTGRPAWAWTLDERLKIRCDRALAQARLDDAHDRVRARGLSVPAGSRTVDVISGHRHPELFLPHELF